MAASSLLALIDDIATLLDDVALLTKIASQKTAGVLGDDLALNAQQVTGVAAERELPVVWAVAKGSLRNKAILVPAALLLSAVAPWAVMPLLMVGGAFLCFEGFEKIAHQFLGNHGDDTAHQEELIDLAVDLLALERDKIRGAIRTDFVLSAEIIAITLGTVAGAALPVQAMVLSGVAVIMTAGVYGLVAGIVKLDDAGLHLSRRAGDAAWPRLQRRLGNGLLKAAPWLMKFLSVAGTAAMFLVGGGILVHGLPVLHHWIDAAAQGVGTAPGIGKVLGAATPLLLDTVAGVLAGAMVLAVVSGVSRLLGRSAG